MSESASRVEALARAIHLSDLHGAVKGWAIARSTIALALAFGLLEVGTRLNLEEVGQWTTHGSRLASVSGLSLEAHGLYLGMFSPTKILRMTSAPNEMDSSHDTRAILARYSDDAALRQEPLARRDEIRLAMLVQQELATRLESSYAKAFTLNLGIGELRVDLDLRYWMLPVLLLLAVLEIHIHGLRESERLFAAETRQFMSHARVTLAGVEMPRTAWRWLTAADRCAMAVFMMVCSYLIDLLTVIGEDSGEGLSVVYAVGLVVLWLVVVACLAITLRMLRQAASLGLPRQTLVPLLARLSRRRWYSRRRSALRRHGAAALIVATIVLPVANRGCIIEPHPVSGATIVTESIALRSIRAALFDSSSNPFDSSTSPALWPSSWLASQTDTVSRSQAFWIVASNNVGVVWYGLALAAAAMQFRALRTRAAASIKAVRGLLGPARHLFMVMVLDLAGFWIFAGLFSLATPWWRLLIPAAFLIRGRSSGEAWVLGIAVFGPPTLLALVVAVALELSGFGVALAAFLAMQAGVSVPLRAVRRDLVGRS